MIDFANIDKYRENNRIEAKKALGGLPQSIWETYSAFANTLGGIILLGVIEKEDKTFDTVNLPDPEQLIKEFWNTVNNPAKVSINLLSSKDVFVQKVNGDRIVVINVPKAERSYKPVYVNGNPLYTYRRNGEGDYKCTREEYQAMVRDASYKSQDMLIIEEMGLDVINRETLRSYRRRMYLSRPGHVWEPLDDEDFLMKIGACGIGSDGKKHPTAAGLLMFGNEYDIVREYNNYFLDYREQFDTDTRWTDRIISSSGDWSGNVYDFYFKVYNRLIQHIKTPFRMKDGLRVDDTPIHKALREALANCLVNADYYGRRGVVVVKGKGKIVLSNPGGFRIDVNAAKSGGVSDPRNGTMMKMLNLIDIGERAGSGIPNIFRVWRDLGWPEPEFHEAANPERIDLTFKVEYDESIENEESTSDNGVEASDNGVEASDNGVEASDNSVKASDNGVEASDNGVEASDNTGKASDNKRLQYLMQRDTVIQYLTDHPAATNTEIARMLDLSAPRSRSILARMAEEDLIESVGANRTRRYRLKV